MIDNVKKVIDLGVDIKNQYEEAVSDGKFNASDLFGFLDELLRLQGVIESAPAAWEELKSSSHPDRSELEEYVKSKDIAADDVESVITASFDLAIAGTKVFAAFKALGGQSDPG